jgi:hypothetical protein
MSFQVGKMGHMMRELPVSASETDRGGDVARLMCREIDKALK